MKIRYERWTPSADAQRDIDRAEQVCAEYATQGFDLTLRQLYYQFVARGWIPNTMRSYKRLGEVVNRGRLSGRIDWDFIVDRTRNLRANGHWSNPGSIIHSAAESFALDKWVDQPNRVEVWVEKDALAGIVGQVANERDVAWFACRGYVSQSELWGAAQRLLRYLAAGQDVTILHLGDHDPSGIDMTRDIRDRLGLFLGYEDEDYPDRVEVHRIALNRDQVERYNPPPNPAKLTDSRATGYVREHGTDSWELDALDPATLAGLIGDHIDAIVQPDLYQMLATTERKHRQLLTAAATRWHEVVELLGGGDAR